MRVPRIVRHKFNAQITERDGMKFSSKKEARYYDNLKIMMADGFTSGPPVAFFLRQVPFHLPGNVKYVCDFQVFYKDGTIEFVDVKGHRTAQYKAKKKMVEALYPIEIVEV